MNQPELEVARVAARAGARIVATNYKAATRDYAFKDQTFNLVSQTDIDSERAIVTQIRQAFPGHAILAEEEHDTGTDHEHLWVIDPLDGTNNFAHGLPHCAVSVAYYRAGAPFCGVIINPILDDWYEAVRGQGARHNGQPVRVSTEATLDRALIGVGFFYDRGVMMESTLGAIGDLFRAQIHGIRRIAPASVDLCYVGLGRFGAFFEYELAPWDHAAGRLFVEEAGGHVTTCRGQALNLERSSVLASNGLVHDQVLAIVNRHFPEGWGP